MFTKRFVIVYIATKNQGEIRNEVSVAWYLMLPTGTLIYEEIKENNSMP